MIVGLVGKYSPTMRACVFFQEDEMKEDETQPIFLSLFIFPLDKPQIAKWKAYG